MNANRKQDLHGSQVISASQNSITLGKTLRLAILVLTGMLVGVAGWMGLAPTKIGNRGASAEGIAGSSASACSGALPTNNSTEFTLADLAQKNLFCAEGLPGSERVDMAKALATLDEWAEHVRAETERYMWKFRANPSEFNNSEGYFRVLTMITVLQQDFGVQYNPERIRSPDFSDSRDLFLHGLLTGKRQGTCVSMPVLYVAVGRRLGYPLKLVTAKAHLFARWEGRIGPLTSSLSPTEGARGKYERFNIEATSQGLSCFPDEYYHTWPVVMTTDEIASGQYLKSLTPAEEQGVFLSARGSCLEAAGRFPEAQLAHAQAHVLAPKTPLYLALLTRAVERELAGRRPTELRVGQAPESLASQPKP